MIDTISIRNFKSFGDDVSVDLAAFNVFVGPNASGKTNLVDAFRFAQHCVNEGIGPAVARRYGWSNIRCRRRPHAIMSFALAGSMPDDLTLKVGGKDLEFAKPQFRYNFSFSHHNDVLLVTEENGYLDGGAREEGERGSGKRISAFRRTVDNIHLEESTSENGHGAQEISVLKPNQDRLFVAATFSSLAAVVINNEMTRWRFYDPDPRLARLPSLAHSVDAVSETGDTLALVLHELRRAAPGDGDLRQRLLDLLQVLVPGFEDWDTEQLADGRIAFKIRERGLRGTLPSLLMSDGTVRLLTILAALLWAEVPPSAIFIEEPERSLHPAVMGPLVELMREVSQQTQIFVTTHSADFVRHCQPEEVYLLDKVDGCTRISPATDVEQIHQFLKRFTLDQLWLQGHLERGIP